MESNALPKQSASSLGRSALIEFTLYLALYNNFMTLMKCRQSRVAQDVLKWHKHTSKFRPPALDHRNIY